MTRKTSLGGLMAAVFVAGALGWTAPAIAQAAAPSQRQLNLAALRADRKALVANNMSLTPDEAKSFWPLFDQYEAAMDKIEKRHADEVKEYAANFNNLTDDQAAKKLDETVAIQQARVDTQKEFIPKFRAVLPGIKVTRFFQIDNKVHAMVQCDLAQMIPLAAPASGH
ncbi:MAG TPA: hypothetical protein VIX12_06185 [Candidatus Binataceae bacterium]